MAVGDGRSGQAGGVPPSDGDLTTTRGLRLPASALFESFARGSGPGGQHRNVTASAVELVADLNALDGPGASRVRAVLGGAAAAAAEASWTRSVSAIVRGPLISCTRPR